MNHVALYGMGTAMKGIAIVLSRNGMRVTAVSPTQNIANELRDAVVSNLENSGMRNIFLPDDLWHDIRDAQKSIDRINFTSEFTAVSSRDIQMVIEVLPDDLMEKRRAIENLHKLTAYNTIIATHSESLRAKDIFAGVPRKDRLIGAHFVHPITKTRLVELTLLLETSRKTLDSVASLVSSVQHTWHVCKDEPGLLTNRLLTELLKERKRMIQDKVATEEEVDEIFRTAFRTDVSLTEVHDAIGPTAIQRLLSRRT